MSKQMDGKAIDGKAIDGKAMEGKAMRFLAALTPALLWFATAPSAQAIGCKTNADCNDSLYCNGVETCFTGIAGGICISGVAPTCDDGKACTADSCTELNRCQHDSLYGVDNDGDGHDDVACGGDDCDDGDATRFPGNVEVCDGVDHDEDCDPTTFGDRDADADGFFDARCCNVQPDSTLVCGDDCDDLEDDVHPHQTETCNGIDDNCEAGIDENLLVTLFPDLDQDGHGDVHATPVLGCPGEPGTSQLGNDCDDNAAAVQPGSLQCDITPANIRLCTKTGVWQTVTCGSGQTCVAQPDGSGVCTVSTSSLGFDNDGISDIADNCPYVYNPQQTDADANGIGDACECGDANGDGFVNTLDARLVQRHATGELLASALVCGARP